MTGMEDKGMSDRFATMKQEILDGIEKHAASRAEAFELRKQFLDSKIGRAHV